MELELNKTVEPKLSDNVSIRKKDEKGNDLVENNLSLIPPMDDQSAYETIIQKLQESKEEWWLVSPGDEDKGYAYRKSLAPTK